MAEPRDDIADDLAEHLAGDYEFAAIEDGGQQLAPLEDDATVDRMLRRRSRLLTERARITDVASAEIQRIKAWEQDRTAGIDRQQEWVDRGLEGYARQVLPARGIKSLSLPNGTLRLTAPGAPSMVVDELSTFVAWATDDEHPERDALLRRTVDVEKADAKRAFRVGPRDEERSTDEVDVFAAVDADGAIVPGLSLTKPAAARFSVVPPADTAGTRNEEMEA